MFKESGFKNPEFRLHEKMLIAKSFYHVQCISDDLNYLDRSREYILDSMSGIILPKPLTYSEIKNYLELGLSEFVELNCKKDNDLITKYIKFLIEVDDFIIINRRKNNGK